MTKEKSFIATLERKDTGINRRVHVSAPTLSIAAAMAEDISKQCFSEVTAVEVLR